MNNIYFNNCDGIFNKQHYFYEEEEVAVVASKSFDNTYYE